MPRTVKPRQPKLPKKPVTRLDVTRVKVGYKYYDIKEIDAEVANTDAIYGDTDNDASVIRVRTEKVQDLEIMNTLVHEILHAVCSVFNIYPVDASGVEEERVVNLMANGLTTVIVDNPEFLDQLVKLKQ